MTTDVVNTIVASDEKNVNKLDKDCTFIDQWLGSCSQPPPDLDSHWSMEPNSVKVHRVEIILEVLEIRLRQSY